MTVRKWAVIDASNVVVNVILVGDPMPANYWPGYGMFLCYQGPADPKEADSAHTDSSRLQMFPRTPTFGGVTPYYKLGIGDVISAVNGTVFRFVPNLIQQEQPDGTTIQVSSAPSVTLKDDAGVRP